MMRDTLPCTALKKCMCNALVVLHLLIGGYVECRIQLQFYTFCNSLLPPINEIPGFVIMYFCTVKKYVRYQFTHLAFKVSTSIAIICA